MADLMYKSQYFGMLSPSYTNSLSEWASKSTLLGGAPASAPATSSGFNISPQTMSTVGAIMGVAGGIQAGFGAYFSAKSTANNLEFQAKMSEINARAAEVQAQSIMDQGQKAIGQVTMKAGKVVSAQKVSQASRGIAMGEGSAAEEVATTELMKEIDKYTINANAVRAAEAARMQKVNYMNDSLLKNTTADTISPFSSAATSLMSSASTVASSWYNSSRSAKIAAALGIE